MFGINLKHSLATVAVAAGVLAAAGPASAGTHRSGLVSYNGHAGLGASAYQHNQTDLEFLAFSPAGVTDGTSHPRQELHRLCADHRRDGPALRREPGGLRPTGPSQLWVRLKPTAPKRARTK